MRTHHTHKNTYRFDMVVRRSAQYLLRAYYMNANEDKKKHTLEMDGCDVRAYRWCKRTYTVLWVYVCVCGDDRVAR